MTAHVKAVSVRMPIQLYNRVKMLADKEYISVSGFIFNVLDKAIYQKGVRSADILENSGSGRRTVSQLVSGVLSDSREHADEPESGSGTDAHVNLDIDLPF